jgi:hypothetical protein
VPDQPIRDDVRSEPVGVVIAPLPVEPQCEREAVGKVLRVSKGEFGILLGHYRSIAQGLERSKNHLESSCPCMGLAVGSR